jgi:hypothetical protein
VEKNKRSVFTSFGVAGEKEEWVEYGGFLG